ncbi:hypothetical protein F5Y10DRAFT_248379 [Nemania abortiva]|nr:hypothetical protein F5Y10DRAFT_248379 [Nemania abortiva]
MSGLKLNILARLMPWRVESEAIRHFLEDESNGNKWRDSKLSELTVVNITGALIASVVSSVFSWSTIEHAPWTAKALFYSTLFMSLTSVAAGSQQSIALYRLGGHEEGLKLLKKLLSNSPTSDNEKNSRKVKPSAIQLYVWQMPIMVLNVSISLFLIGVAIVVWDRAAQQPSWNDDTKIAFVASLAGFCALTNYIMGSFFIYRGGSSRANVVQGTKCNTTPQVDDQHRVNVTSKAPQP